MNDHVAKPIDPEVLNRTLKTWLSTKIAPAAEPTAVPAVEPGSETLSASAAVAATMPTLPAAFFALDGLDAATGLRQAMGKPKLYLALLSKFVDGQQDFRSAIRASLAQGDLKTAVRQAHTLKGVAAQIGASTLSAIAASLEQALQQALEQGAASGQTEALIEEAGTRLDQLIAAMSPHLAAAAPGVAAVPLDREKFAAVCARLQKLLAESDCASLELAESQASLLRAGLGERHEALMAAISNFDYDLALDCLKDSAS